MTIEIDQIEAILLARGYRGLTPTKSKRGFQRGANQPVYLNLKSKAGQTALVVHPESGIEALRDQSSDLQIGETYFHSSNMLAYPKRTHTGKGLIPYGWGVTFESEGAVNLCLDFVEGDRSARSLQVDASASLYSVDLAPDAAPGADVPALGKRRIGQEQFRSRLLAYWKGCAVTGVTTLQLLRASHITPWVNASEIEKTDAFNGLLLSPHLDAAFDAGLISFDDDGRLLMSAALSREDAKLLGIHGDMRLRRLDVRHRPYLAAHRRSVFAG